MNEAIGETPIMCILKWNCVYESRMLKYIFDLIDENIPEMCRIADACSSVETLRGIAWISFILTILSGIACDVEIEMIKI